MFFPSEIDEYCSQNSKAISPVLQKLYRDTHLKMINPRMLSGPLQGMLLTIFSRLLSPMYILEIGTYTGYSAICLAQGLKTGGHLFSIEIDDETALFANKYIIEAGFEKSITIHVGDACKVIPTLEPKFDLIFIDGEKQEYPEYYNLCINKLNKGGYIIADNVLWNGKVIDPAAKNDPATKAIIKFNRMVTEDSRVENLLLPLRDGLMILRKI